MLHKLHQIIKGDSSIMGELARGSAGTFIVKIFGLITSFVIQVYLARLLGVNEYGDFIFSITLMSLCVLVGKVGLDTASIKFVAAYNSEHEYSYLRGFIKFSNRFVLTFSLVIGIVVASIITQTNFQNTSSYRTTIWTVCILLVPLNALILTIVAQLRGMKRIVLPQALSDLFRPLVIILVLTVMHIAFTYQLKAIHAVSSHIFAAFLVVIFLVYISRNILQTETSQLKNSYSTRLWISTAIPMLMIAVFNFIFAQADILLIGTIGSTADAGLYAPSKRLANLINLVLTSVNMISAPLIAELYAKNSIVSLQKAVRISAAWIFIFSLPCCIIMLVFAKQLLFLFGPEFADGYRSLQVLSLSQFCNAVAGTVGYLMIMTGYQATASKVLGITAILNIILNLFLIPRFGILGAAYTNFITTFMWNALMLFYTFKYLHINPTVFQKHTIRRTP